MRASRYTDLGDTEEVVLVVDSGYGYPTARLLTLVTVHYKGMSLIACKLQQPSLSLVCLSLLFAFSLELPMPHAGSPSLGFARSFLYLLLETSKALLNHQGITLCEDRNRKIRKLATQHEVGQRLPQELKLQ